MANVEIFQKIDFLRQARKIEEVHREELSQLASDLPLLDTRVCGTVAAFEFCSEKKDYLSPDLRSLTAIALKKGLFLWPLGNTIYLMPPYGTPEKDLREAWGKLNESLRELLYRGKIDVRNESF